jgi:transcription termination factor Rho
MTSRSRITSASPISASSAPSAWSKPADVVLLSTPSPASPAPTTPPRNSGRTGTGGLDVRALEKPRQLFASARKTEDGGSLTIIASMLVETGSRMDDVIFQEFKGTGNMELVLDRKCAEMRLWPAVNIAASGTRKEELLIDAKTLEGIHFFRRALVQQKIEEATDTMIARLSKTKTNAEFSSSSPAKFALAPAPASSTHFPPFRDRPGRICSPLLPHA